MRITAIALAILLLGTSASHALPPTGTTYNLPPDPLPSTLGDGDVLNVNSGGVVPDLYMAGPGSTINLQPGGTIGWALTTKGIWNVNASGSFPSWHIDGGVLNANAGVMTFGELLAGAVMNVQGGNIVASVSSTDSTINFSSGSMSTAYLYNSTLNFYGPGFGEGEVFVQSDSTVNIYGGTFVSTAGPTMYVGGVLNLFVKNASLNGAPLGGLTSATPVIVAQRGGATLAGALASGEVFSIPLYDVISNPGRGSSFHDTSVVRVTLVPEPASAVLMVAAAFGLTLLGRRRRE
jgi:hypothetical protein